MQVRFLRWILSGAFLSMAALCDAAPTLSPQVALVVKLYKEFEIDAFWQATETSGFGNFTPPEVLLQYVTPELTQLLVDDLKCQDRERAICNVQMPVAWGVSDTTRLTVRIRATNDANRVEVQIRSADNLRGPAIRKLIYRVSKTSRGWRIRDIEYHGIDHNTYKLLEMLKRP